MRRLVLILAGAALCAGQMCGGSVAPSPDQQGGNEGQAAQSTSSAVPSLTIITSQPQSQTVTAGADVSLSVTASGDDPLTYQWQKDNANLTDGGRVYGVTSPTLQIFAATSVDTGGYWCMVTGGGGSLLSDVATLTVSAGNCTLSTTSWQNHAIAVQIGTFTAEFDGTPLDANMDGVIGLSAGAPSDYAGFAALVRFSSTGNIDAYDGAAGDYRADVPVPYAPASRYHFRLTVDVAAHIYSVYLTQPGSGEQRLARDYAFRTGGVTSLDNRGFIAGIGSLQVCDFTLVSVPMFTISGRVADGTGIGIGGVTMTGLPGNPVTDASGGYSAAVAIGFSGTAFPSLAGYSFSPASRTYANVTVAQGSQDYTAIAPAAPPVTVTRTISGRVTDGSGGAVSGVAISGLPGRPVTDANGNYVATVASGFSGTALPSKVGYRFSPATRSYGNTTADQGNQDFIAVPTTTYYVATLDPNADDANPGTEPQPWNTLARATGTVQAGDTVVVKAGSYGETLSPRNSGSAGAPITFKANPGDAVLIDGAQSLAKCVDLTGRDYIRIEGFEIKDSASEGIYMRGCTGIEIIGNYIHHTGDYVNWDAGGFGIAAGRASNCLIEGNELYYTASTAIDCENGGQLASNMTIRGNNIHHSGRDGIGIEGTDFVVENNTFSDSCFGVTHQDAIVCEWCDGLTIRGNVISDFTQLIYVALPAGAQANNVRVYNNVFYNDQYDQQQGGDTPGIYFALDAYPATARNIEIHSNTFGFLGYSAIWIYPKFSGSSVDGVRIRNNIFYGCTRDPGSPAMDWDGPITNISSDYNCFFGTMPTSGYDAHGISADPRLMNYFRHSAWNFGIQSDSPCIRAGDPALPALMTLSVPWLDMNGVVRPTPCSIGAYEPTH